MDLKITPVRLSGSVSAIPSKSAAHRALICGALSEKGGKIKLSSLSEDTAATMGCLSALGAEFIRRGEWLEIKPLDRKNTATVALDCGESGSTLRFLLPLCAALGRDARFVCRGRLAARPMDDICEALAAHGVKSDGRSVSGRLAPGEYALSGSVSSQYLTGLLIALAAAGGGTVKMTSPLSSKPYIDITKKVLSDFGVKITEEEGVYTVPRNAAFSLPDGYAVEGDWSAAAFWLPFGIGVVGLDEKSPQGDRAICTLLEALGAKRLSDSPLQYSTESAGGAAINLSDTPDLFPPLAARAALSREQTDFLGTERLRFKESDRIESTAAMLSSLGASLTQKNEKITVSGESLHGGEVDSFGDHRIAMSAAALSGFCTGEVVIRGADSANKSYPSFWQDFCRLGGKITEV